MELVERIATTTTHPVVCVCVYVCTILTLKRWLNIDENVLLNCGKTIWKICVFRFSFWKFSYCWLSISFAISQTLTNDLFDLCAIWCSANKSVELLVQSYNCSKSHPALSFILYVSLCSVPQNWWVMWKVQSNFCDSGAFFHRSFTSFASKCQLFWTKTETCIQ